jgi:response regulator RpfG family c-di-GMP phosphodiesterase
MTGSPIARWISTEAGHTVATPQLLALDPASANRGRCAVTEPSKSRVQTVLVVEDEVFIRLVISEYLRDCGYRVIEAANADEALIVLEHLEIAVDVVFSDIEMPGSIGGFDLANWLRTLGQRSM